MTAKRILDFILTIPFLFIAAPFVGITALLILIFMGPPVFYPMKRPGLHGKSFVLYKFRTMTNALDKQGNLLPDCERLSKFGRVLRILSLDELPELLNVIKGEMSLVGPRPLLLEYLDRYTPEQMRRHDVKPGITGWAQVNGRNALTWEQKFLLDLWYVDHISIGLDMKILWLTLIKVLKREGISAQDHVTMPGFRGTSTLDPSSSESERR